PGHESGKPKHHVGPRTSVEEMVCGILSRVLGRQEISVDDNFFEIGGHSLHATRVISQIRLLLGVQVDFRRFFDAPTAASLARIVEEKTAVDAADTKNLLSQIENLSADQVRQLLAKHRTIS